MHAPAGDIMKNYRPLVAPQLEAGVRIMIYAGVGEFTVSAAVVRSSACSQCADSVGCAADDWICNWMGNHKWLSEMKWSQQADFLSAPERNFTVDSAVAGSVQAHGPLSFVKIYNAVCAHHQLTGLLAAHPFVLRGLGASCSGKERSRCRCVGCFIAGLGCRATWCLWIRASTPLRCCGASCAASR